MPPSSPTILTLRPEVRRRLERRARRYTLPYFQVVRARMILLAADGLSNAEIGLRLSTRREVVSKWRRRFAIGGLPALDDQDRPGRPRHVQP